MDQSDHKLEGGDPGVAGVHPSLLTTEPTVGPAIITAASAEQLAGEENSLFDKNLIDINTARTGNMEAQQQNMLPGGMIARQSTDYDENNSLGIRQTQDDMHTEGGGNDRQWSPQNDDLNNRGTRVINNNHQQDNINPQKSYYTTKSSGVDGIVGKLGRLEAMILAQGTNNNRKKKNQGAVEKIPFPIKATTIDRIIYPVYTKKGLKYGKPKKKKDTIALQDQLQSSQEPIGKLLDGFLILYSCRVKLPHEAIKSKLASQKIVEVIEEDLCYFQNLNAIDLSDNKVRLEQLRNLKSLVDVNLQYNNIQIIPSLQKEDFPKLEMLNLSYNQLTPASIRHLYQLPRLKNLDLQGNNLVTLPDDLKELKHLEDLNLSSNMLSTQSTLINPAILMKVLGQIPKLKRLNLSRNKLQGLHFDLLNRDEDFVILQELDIGYNLVQEEDDVWYATQIKNLQVIIITGNPFALNGKQAYQRLEEAMQKNLSATVINEDVPDHKTYLKKVKNQKALAAFPYPNPIKLFSRENQSKDHKGEYLNAELMNQGVALQISEIRPDTNIEQEIFPRELTRDAQEKEIFTPPNHKQMRFLKSGGAKQSIENGLSSGTSTAKQPNDGDQFFITENILDSNPLGDSRIIHEERSQQESELDNVPEEMGGDMADIMDNDDDDEEEDNDGEMDPNFDFGKAKMDYFKQRAKDILMNETDIEYEGNAQQLNMCFKNLKNAIRNPVVVHAGSEKKPNYQKMTFSTCRAAVNGDRYLELSKLLGSNGSLKQDSQHGNSTSTFLALGSQSKIPALMRAGKDMQNDDMLGLPVKKKTKKEEMIDKKIEYLLETYKKQDEALLKKATEKSTKQEQDRKNLRDKFGFSDDEEEDNERGGIEGESSIHSRNQNRSEMTGAAGDTKRSKDPFASTGKFQSSQGNKKGGGGLPPVKKTAVY